MKFSAFQRKLETPWMGPFKTQERFLVYGGHHENGEYTYPPITVFACDDWVDAQAMAGTLEAMTGQWVSVVPTVIYEGN